MSEWQPIETAPKDGAEIIAYGTRRGAYGYTDDVKTWTGVRWGMVCDFSHMAWRETKPRPQYCNGFVPTHWMPLPKPPIT